MTTIREWINKLRSDLGLQVLMMYVLFMLPVVVGGALFDLSAGSRLRQDVMAADLSLARAIAHETETALAQALSAVEHLAAFEAVQSADMGAMESLFGQVSAVRPDVNLIYRLTPDGQMLFHFPIGPGSTVGDDFSFREYFQRAAVTDQPLISLGRISPTTQQAVATAVMPLWEGDDFRGVVATNIKLQSFSDTLGQIEAEQPPEKRLNILILDADGKIIAHPDAKFLLQDVRVLMPGLQADYEAGMEGNFIHRDAQEEEFMYSMVRVPSTDWAVIVSRPTAIAFAALDSIHQSVLLIIAIFVAIGLFFWLVLSTRVLRPIERLAGYSQAIGRSAPLDAAQLAALDGGAGRNDQLGHLTRSFRRMHDDVQARFDELATLLDTSASVVSTLDSEDVLTRILQQVQRLLGVNKCAVVALDAENNVFRAVASLGLSRRYAEQLTISPEEHDSPTMRAIRLDEVVQIYDTEQDASFSALRPRARAEGYRSFASIPLKTTHAPPAALVLYSPQPKAFNAREIALLSHFANHAAMAIENAELYARSDARWKSETQRLQALIQSMESGLIMEDLSGTVLYANRAACEMGGFELDGLIGQPVRRFYASLLNLAQEPEPLREALGEYLMNGQEELAIEVPLLMREGLRYLRLQGFVVKDVNGQMIGRGQILRDITRRYELDRMKSSLISTASHELRTPLAAIKGYASTLLANDVAWEPDAQREFIEVISSEADRLSELVNNLLDMSRIEAGNLELSYVATTANEIVENAILSAYPHPGRPVQREIDEALPLLVVDVPRIEAVVRKLIENAVKYAGADAAISVRAALDGEQVRFEVQDDGPGVPLEAQERVFSSFYRASAANRAGIAGVGLGLAICRGFVGAHGGSIWLDTSRPGTCVVFTLPIEPELAMEPLARQEV